MKRLFFNSLFLLVCFLLANCASNKNNAGEIQQNTTQNDTIAPKEGTRKTTEAKVQKGASKPSQSSDTSSSKRGAHYNKTETKHNAPNQNKIDSIKREKTKKKKQTSPPN